MTVNALIGGIIAYAEERLCLDRRNADYVRNRLLGLFGQGSYSPEEGVHFNSPDELVSEALACALACGVAEQGGEESFADRLMAMISLSPAEVDARFASVLASDGSKAATDWLYGYCVSNYYVRRAVLDKNPRFDAEGVTVTINKAKPEFRDPKKAAAGNSVSGGYPACVICRSNEGYGPRNKRTLRTVSIRLGGEDFFWQYSPYGYFREHGIAVNCTHRPMYVDRSTFYKLMDFVDIFPHYFIGCNAPLPRIGGSVLAHDHYQGGGERLPLHRAGMALNLKNQRYPSLAFGIVDWQGSVVRVCGSDRDEVAAASEEIRRAWCAYDNRSLGIVSEDENGVHNAVSPTVVKTAEGYEMTLILRSNITSAEYPDGVFHAHPEYHMIKKESIGLIEAQGLFILPGRLERQLAGVEECVKAGALSDDLREFGLVYSEVKAMGGDVHEAMKKELGSICCRILGNTAVFGQRDDFVKFLGEVGWHE